MTHRNATRSSLQRRCSFCGTSWRTREDFLSDPQIVFIGYQAKPGKHKVGLFLFNHGPCHSTISLGAEAFADLHAGPIFGRRSVSNEECGAICQHRDQLGPSMEECECAYVWEVSSLVARWPKLSTI